MTDGNCQVQMAGVVVVTPEDHRYDWLKSDIKDAKLSLFLSVLSGNISQCQNTLRRVVVYMINK